jgi:predicted metal-dependent enzyme (double-stranded beta helix superfamily)
MVSYELDAFATESQKVLEDLSAPDRLQQCLLIAKEDQRLFSLSEHYDILDKIVLYADERYRIRLHIFGDGYFDRPHNHRWSYSSKILSGGYRHTIYSLDRTIAAPEQKHLVPVLVRQEKAGDFYTLHHSQYHSVTAEPGTVTLIYRGPAEADRFRVMDRTTQAAWWQYGTDIESQKEKESKRMTRERFDILVEKLKRLGILC